LQPEVLSGLLQDAYMTRSSRRSVATATVTATDMQQGSLSIAQIIMFSSSNRPCNCRTDYTNWSQSHWPAKWWDTWNVQQTLELIEIVKKLSYSLANGPQRIRKEGVVWHLMFLCFGCTLVVQCDRMEEQGWMSSDEEFRSLGPI